MKIFHYFVFSKSRHNKNIMDFIERFVNFNYSINKDHINTTQILAYSLFGIGTLYLM